MGRRSRRCSKAGNREPLGQTQDHFEILNFGVPNYSPLQQLVVLDKAFGFSPGMLIYVATGGELGGSARYLVKAIREGIPVPYDYLRETARRVQIDASTDETTALRRLEPVMRDVLAWTYAEIVRRCQERGIRPVWMFLPQVDNGYWRSRVDELRHLAEQAGFPIVDLRDYYAGRDVRAIRLADWDYHPNAEGHRLIADQLYQAFSRNAGWFSSAGPRQASR
jgi:hypothetical protein